MLETSEGISNRYAIFKASLENYPPGCRSAWYDIMTIHDRAGNTVLCGPLADQAALYGLLGRVRDLRIPLLSSTRVEVAQP